MGESHTNSKLTENNVKDILNALVLGSYTQKELSKQYNVTSPVINKIANGKNWKHVYKQLSNEDKEKIWRYQK